MLLGRTNESFSPIWLSLSLPDDPADINPLVMAALNGDCPIDISSQPGLWGHHLRGTDATLMTIGGSEVSNANNEEHASTLVQAHLIQTLSSVGRPMIDCYFLEITQSLEEFQLAGALSALAMAKEDGLVRFIGLAAEGNPIAVLSQWQFHDAFEVLLVAKNHYSQDAWEMLSPLARERRVGVVTSRPFNWKYGLPFMALPSVWRLRNLTQSFYGLTLAQAVLQDLATQGPVLVGVRTANEALDALTCLSVKAPAGVDAMVQTFREALDLDENWQELAKSSSAHIRTAAERRKVDLERV